MSERGWFLIALAGAVVLLMASNAGTPYSHEHVPTIAGDSVVYQREWYRARVREVADLDARIAAGEVDLKDQRRALASEYNERSDFQRPEVMQGQGLPAGL